MLARSLRSIKLSTRYHPQVGRDLQRLARFAPILQSSEADDDRRPCAEGPKLKPTPSPLPSSYLQRFSRYWVVRLHRLGPHRLDQMAAQRGLRFSRYRLLRLVRDNE